MMRLHKLIAFLSVLTLFFSACEDSSSAASETVLERPIKAVFFCTETVDGSEIPLAASECNDDSSYYAVILSSSKGEIALVNLKDKSVVDLDKNRPGFNLLGVGRVPMDMALDSETQEIVVLLSDPASVARIKISDLLERAAGNDVSDIVSIYPLRTSEGNISANPSRLAYYSHDSIFVLFPRCGMMAKTNSQGLIRDSWKTSDSTDLILNTGSEVRCPSENTSVENPAPVEDAPYASFMPSVLTIDSSVLYVAGKGDSDEEHDFILRWSLDENGDASPLTPLSLQDGTQGFVSLGISPETRWGKFLYAVTVKGDVRVLRLSDGAECDTNVDLQLFDEALDIDSDLRGCIPVGFYKSDILSTTPGIHLNYGRKFAAVTFFDYDASEDSVDLKSKKTFNGIFAVLVSTDGLFYAVNLDETFDDELFEYRYGDAGTRVWPEEVLAHRIRNTTDLAGGTQYSGRPHMDSIFYYWIDGVGHEYQNGEPTLAKFDTDYYLDNIAGYLIRSENWMLTYKGRLPYSARDFGIVDADATDENFELADTGANFCKAGAKPGDILQITGCFDDNECSDGYKCMRSPMQKPETNGLCFPEDASTALFNSCSRLLASDREYLITSVSSDKLQLAPNPLYAPGETVPHACTSDLECRELGYENGGVCLKNEGYCVSAPSPVTEDGDHCLSGLLSYEIRIDDGFLMKGGVTPYVSPYETDESGNCVLKDATDIFSYRIPAVSGRQHTPFFDFKLYIDSEVEIPVYYSVQFQILTGFSRYAVDAGIRLPSWLGVAPDGNVYVLDEGDTYTYGYTGQFLKLVPRYFAMDTSFTVR